MPVAEPRPAVDRDDARLVNHLEHDHDVAGDLDDLYALL